MPIYWERWQFNVYAVSVGGTTSQAQPFESLVSAQRKIAAANTMTSENAQQTSAAEPLARDPPSSLTNFDPRHSQDRIQNPSRALEQLAQLRNIFPKTGRIHNISLIYTIQLWTFKSVYMMWYQCIWYRLTVEILTEAEPLGSSL